MVAASSPEELKQMQTLFQSFFTLNTTGQDRLLTLLIQTSCSKRQLSLLANLILPRLKLDIVRHLPHEIALHVLSYLPVKSLCRLACCSSYHRQAVYDNHLWRHLSDQHHFSLEDNMLQRYLSAPLPTTDFSVHQQRLLQQFKHRDIDYRNFFRSQFTIRNNWNSGQCTHFAIEGPQNAIVTSLQFNNHVLAIATDNSAFGLIEIFDSRNGTRIRQLTGHEGGVWALEFSGSTLLSGGCDRDLRYMLPKSVRELTRLGSGTWKLGNVFIDSRDIRPRCDVSRSLTSSIVSLAHGITPFGR